MTIANDSPILSEPVLDTNKEKKKFNDHNLHEINMRQKILVNHPIFNTDVQLETAPILILNSMMRRALLLRESICLSAASGAGKTQALIALTKFVNEEFPHIVVYKFDTENFQVPSIRAFFQHVLDAVGHLEDKGETYQLRKRVRNRLVDDARQAGGNIVLLLIDEAQELSIDDFKFLKDIGNALERNSVQLITVMMGEDPKFNCLRRKLIDDRHLDLVGRFLMRMLTFPTFGTLDDIEMVLTGFDRSIYPPDSGWSWTQFIFPLAWASGFRLQNESKNFLQALEKSASKKKAPYSFPARQTFFALRTFCMDNAGHDMKDMALPADSWNSAVEYAQVALAMDLAKVSKFDKKETKILT